MTTEFKMPEPFGLWHSGQSDDPDESDFYLYEVSGDVSCKFCTKLYTADDMRAVIEQCAQICERAKSLYTQGTMYSHVPGMFQIRADEIRKLLEQVK